MNNSLMIDNNNLSRSLTVEQNEEDFITIKKKLKNTEYSVEILVFKKEDIDEFLEIQKELYSGETDKKDILKKLLGLLKKLVFKKNYI